MNIGPFKCPICDTWYRVDPDNDPGGNRCMDCQPRKTYQRDTDLETNPDGSTYRSRYSFRVF